MDKSDVIKLISVTTTQDAYGIWQKTESSAQVYCRVESISQREFFDAGRNGLNPEYKFIVFFGDYNNEMVVEGKAMTAASINFIKSFIFISSSD